MSSSSRRDASAWEERITERGVSGVVELLWLLVDKRRRSCWAWANCWRHSCCGGVDDDIVLRLFYVYFSMHVLCVFVPKEA